MSTNDPCPTCGYQMDRVDQMGTENKRLREALKPFADVVEALHGIQELDRDAVICMTMVSIQGSGATGGCMLTDDDFHRAYRACRQSKSYSREPT